MKSDLHPMRGRGGMERGGRGGRYWNAGGDFSSGVSHNEMHRQETLELARMEQMMHRVSTKEGGRARAVWSMLPLGGGRLWL